MLMGNGSLSMVDNVSKVSLTLATQSTQGLQIFCIQPMIPLLVDCVGLYMLWLVMDAAHIAWQLMISDHNCPPQLCAS